MQYTIRKQMYKIESEVRFKDTLYRVRDRRDFVNFSLSKRGLIGGRKRVIRDESEEGGLKGE